MRAIRTSLGVSLVALLFAAGALVGCSGSKASEEKAPKEQASQEQAAASDETADGEEEATRSIEEDVTELTSASVADDGLVDAGDFSFVIPEYWRGRVSCGVREVDGKAVASIALADNPDAVLVKVSVFDGDMPEAAGDLANHIVGFKAAADEKTHVEVWSTNWPWLVANGQTKGLSEAELRELVDLSTGGAVSYEEAVAASGDEVSAAEKEFVSSQLVPTLVVG